LIASKLAVFGCPKQHGFVLPYQKQVMVMNFVFKNVVAYFFILKKIIFNISTLKKNIILK
jgi:hypothetical protein